MRLLLLVLSTWIRKASLKLSLRVYRLILGYIDGMAVLRTTPELHARAVFADSHVLDHLHFAKRLLVLVKVGVVFLSGWRLLRQHLDRRLAFMIHEKVVLIVQQLLNDIVGDLYLKYAVQKAV